jgi:hypothetical protein
MFLRSKTRSKDGKVHRYWSVVENRRVGGDRVVQRELLYLGEINDTQQGQWLRIIDTLQADGKTSQLAMFAETAVLPEQLGCEAVQVRLDQMQLHNPRQWGACWLCLHLWDVLELDKFWQSRLAPSRQGTRWLNVLKALVVYRLIDPGSEWRFHRQWFSGSAMADLLGENFSLAQKDKPYRCLDKLLEHKEALFDFLKDRWSTLFGVTYDMILYDLTSTYFESDPPLPDSPSKKRFGYSRDHRSDCVQVVIALVVTPEGLPLAYEVLAGNTRDTATLEQFMGHIEKRYGKARRTWLMDRGIPTEETLEKMRTCGIDYLVGTPKGRLTRLEQALLEVPWSKAREQVRVKTSHEPGGDFYVYVESQDRVAKERSMRQRRLRALIKNLQGLSQRKRLTRDELLMGLGAAKKQAGRAWSLMNITVPGDNQALTAFSYGINRGALRIARRREGRYLLRSNCAAGCPQQAWENYLLLTRIEQAFKDLKGDLSIRPIYHSRESRIEAHIFVCFLAYCLHTTLRNLTRRVAGGLTPGEILATMANIQMIDVHLPTTDGRQIVMSRYTHPNKETSLVLAALGLTLPDQPPPKVYSSHPAVVPTF